jgi:hypothetical protein
MLCDNSRVWVIIVIIIISTIEDRKTFGIYLKKLMPNHTYLGKFLHLLS